MWCCMLYVATSSPHETAPTYSSIPNIHKRNQAPKSMMKNNKPWKLTLAALTSLLSPHSSYSPNSLPLAPIQATMVSTSISKPIKLETLFFNHMQGLVQTRVTACLDGLQKRKRDRNSGGTRLDILGHKREREKKLLLKNLYF